MGRPRLYLLYWLYLLIFAAPVAVAARDKNGRAIEAAAQAWLEAYHARDLDRLMTHYEPDVRVMLNNQPALVGKTAVRDYFRQAFAKPLTINMSFTIEDIHVQGQTAHLVSLYQMTVAECSQNCQLAGRSLLVYRKGKDGVWRIAADMDNATPDVKKKGN
jgi:uncharacterized protein (TIGR02246 family)